MIKSHLSKIYWPYSMIHVTHILNMLLTPVLNYSSPHEMFYKTTLDFNQLKVFGSLRYASTLSPRDFISIVRPTINENTF